ncbi:hypothetical protein IWQ47_001944 [Aquimarina sp. EL_43]|uniref:hypothetical protein n=1 Tax=unclassified Aquimarina TaxID=2627091 RepID=UPI0018CB09EF|nr:MULTISPECIES: hypothetical protein [unclassified Aquimarina]MBG6129973.1 hypothetical protein [Aquimarina sp. EL_35]MBG6148753.1 hypothetical protein [Aquimarina sp. EL_32]MBG6168873.1 hypothetical protein [Aquimarina sp. EL_43]
MLKNISSLGVVLKKSEQQSISGGFGGPVSCSATPTFYNGQCWLCGIPTNPNECN